MEIRNIYAGAQTGFDLAFKMENIIETLRYEIDKLQEFSTEYPCAFQTIKLPVLKVEQTNVFGDIFKVTLEERELELHHLEKIFVTPEDDDYEQMTEEEIEKYWKIQEEIENSFVLFYEKNSGNIEYRIYVKRESLPSKFLLIRNLFIFYEIGDERIEKLFLDGIDRIIKSNAMKRINSLVSMVDECLFNACVYYKLTESERKRFYRTVFFSLVERNTYGIIDNDVFPSGFEFEVIFHLLTAYLTTWESDIKMLYIELD